MAGNITLDVRIQKAGQTAWPELSEELRHARIVELDPKHLSIAIIERGLSNGAAAVAIRVDLPDGRCVMVQNTGENFIRLAHAIYAIDNKGSKPPEENTPLRSLASTIEVSYEENSDAG